MIIPLNARAVYERSLQVLHNLSRGYYASEDYQDVLEKMFGVRENFKSAVFEELEEAVGDLNVSIQDQKECFEMCLGYGFLEPAKLLLENNPALLNEKYGNPAVGISDFLHGVITDYKAKELFDKPEFASISAGFKETFHYFTRIQNIPVTPSVIQAQVVAGINPKESAENKAVLVSVQNSIENLLKKYQYLRPGAIPPSGTTSYEAFRGWVSDLKKTRGQEPLVQEAIESFEAVLDAKTDTEHYMDAAEKNRKTLYGAYRFVVRDTKQKFTMQDIFALIWQSIQTEVPYIERQEYLERWVFAMQEAAHAHEEGKNPVVGFEDTTHGCSNAMINPSIAILASIKTFAEANEVQVNYANPQTMSEKAFHGFFADKIEQQWNQAGLIERMRLRRKMEEWVAKPGEGIPDDFYNEDMKQYLMEELKKEYQALMPATELKQISEEIVENLTYRGAPPFRLKQLLMQEVVNDFVERRGLDVHFLKEVLLKARGKQATSEGVWGNKAELWKGFLKDKFVALFPYQITQEEKNSYKTVILEAIRKKILQIIQEKEKSSASSASKRPVTGKSADKSAGERVSVTQKPTIASAAKAKQPTVGPSSSSKPAKPTVVASKGKSTGT